MLELRYQLTLKHELELNEEKNQAIKELDTFADRTFDIELKMKYRANELKNARQKGEDTDEQDQYERNGNSLQAKVDAMVEQQMTNCMNKAIESMFRRKSK